MTLWKCEDNMKKQKNDDQAVATGGEITATFTATRLVLNVAGRGEFFLSRETAVMLFGDGIKEKFPVHSRLPAADLELFVSIERGLQRGKTYADLAGTLNMDTDGVRAFYSRFQSMPSVRRWDLQQYRNEHQRQAVAAGEADGSVEVPLDPSAETTRKAPLF